jgi:hypothetical protein
MIRDNKAVRARYEGSIKPRLDDEASPHSGKTAIEEDPFNDFRTRALDQEHLPRVILDSGTYIQTPSRFASIGNLVSVYSTPNKSDTPGESHRGLSTDTRFGMCGKPSFGTLQRHIERQDNIHRLNMQRQMQNGSCRGRRGRRGRRSGHVDVDVQHRQQGSDLNGRQHNHTLRGPPHHQAQANVNNHSQSAMNDPAPILQHQRFRSQEFSITGTPFTSYSVPINHGQNFRPQVYEDEGPLLHDPYAHSYGQQVFYGQNFDANSFSQQDQSMQGSFNQYGPAKFLVDDFDTARMAQAYSVHRAFAEGFSAHDFQDFSAGATAQDSHARRGSHGDHSWVTSQGGNTQGSSSGDRSRPSFLHHETAQETAFQATNARVAQAGQSGNLQDRRRARNEQREDQAGIEYGHYLDELNNKSRTKGATEFVGDTINGRPALQLQPMPANSLLHRLGFGSPLLDPTQDEENADWQKVRDRIERGPINGTRSIVFEALRAARLRVSQGESASTRPPSPSLYESGRLSEPPRNRPVLLSPIHFEPAKRVGNTIFGERAGNVSREPSPVGRATRMQGRRLFE